MTRMPFRRARKGGCAHETEKQFGNCQAAQIPAGNTFRRVSDRRRMGGNNTSAIRELYGGAWGEIRHESLDARVADPGKGAGRI